MDERGYRLIRDLDESINRGARTNKELAEMFELSIRQQKISVKMYKN